MSRQRINLNREWRFLRDDRPDARDPRFDDSSWQTIGLPHCFDLPWFRTPEFYVGIGWYRKRFILPPRSRPTRWSVEFDGVFQAADIFINNIPIRGGSHQGGYTGFSIDITDALKPGENVLAIRVSNEWNPQLAPRAGEHIFSGGIYRDVHLVATSPLHIAWNGISITTPTVSNESATIRATIEVQNENSKSQIRDFRSKALNDAWHGLPARDGGSESRASGPCHVCFGSPQSQICNLKSQILDPAGHLVATMETSGPIEPNQKIEFELISEIPSPLLWHPDHPHLYILRTQLFRDHQLIDEVDTPFGIRWFEWTADRGFFLNGEHLYLRGANVHQDHAGWGIGITRAACQRDVRLIKEAGFNFIRGAHYPHHPAFADACDRLGVLFWSENAFWGKGGYGPDGYWNASSYPIDPHDFAPFEQSCRDQLREMIEQNRNHPSIIAWSMCNEPFFTFNLDRARALLADLVKLSRQLDPTRPAAIGGAQRGDIDHLGDLAGYNGDGARLFLNPGVPNMVSEYGAITKPHDSCEPFWGDLVPATHASPSASLLPPPVLRGRAGEGAPTLTLPQRSGGGNCETLPPVRQVLPLPPHFSWRSGEAIWCGFDYGSIAGRQGLKGIISHQRLPKQSWHWYRQHNLGIAPPAPPREGEQREAAMLHLDADKTTITGTDATDDAQIIVTVCDADGHPVDNSAPSDNPKSGIQNPKSRAGVTLTIESGPGEFPTGRSITFAPDSDISIAQGQAAIAFRSYHAGESIIRATSPGLKDATITIHTLGEPLFIPGQTPTYPDRPYTPPPTSAAAQKSLANSVNVALNRPSRASSESEHHPARLANDGNPITRWQAARDATDAWWQVDLEGFYQLSASRLTFPSEGHWRYIIELSVDANTWTIAVDRRETERTTAIRNDTYPPGSAARYLRIIITRAPGHAEAPAICDVEIFGILSIR